MWTPCRARGTTGQRLLNLLCVIHGKTINCAISSTGKFEMVVRFTFSKVLNASTWTTGGGSPLGKWIHGKLRGGIFANITSGPQTLCKVVSIMFMYQIMLRKKFGVAVISILILSSFFELCLIFPWFSRVFLQLICPLTALCTCRLQEIHWKPRKYQTEFEKSR